ISARCSDWPVERNGASRRFEVGGGRAVHGRLPRISGITRLAMTDSTSRRFVGRKVVLGFLALTALTVRTTTFLFIRGMEPSGRILALRAEGERSALLLRATKGKRNHVQLVRVLDDGTQPHKITL